MKDVLSSPNHRLTVNIPIDSEAYQSYLSALKNIETERDLCGAHTLEAHEALMQAVEELDQFAKDVFVGDRHKPSN